MATQSSHTHPDNRTGAGWPSDWVSFCAHLDVYYSVESSWQAVQCANLSTLHNCWYIYRRRIHSSANCYWHRKIPRHLRPFLHRRLQQKTLYIAVASIWVFSAVLSSLQPLQYGTDWQVPYTILTASACFFIPVLIIITAYGSIFVVAMKRKKLQSQNQTLTSSLDKEVRFV